MYYCKVYFVRTNVKKTHNRYIFTGSVESRGMKTDRFTSVRHDIAMNAEGDLYSKVVIDIDFTSVSSNAWYFYNYSLLEDIFKNHPA